METVSGNLASALRIEPGITAIIGSGGKSTLLKTLGLELMRAGGRVRGGTEKHAHVSRCRRAMGRVESSPGRRALEAGRLACPRLRLRGMR